MAKPSPEQDLAAIVLAGSFNPGIFHPQWLAAQQFVTPAEAEASKLNLVLPDLASFEIAGWLQVDVTVDRFEARADMARAPDLRDVASTIFQALQHTPVRAVSIYRAVHVPLASEEGRNRFLRTLVPHLPWTTGLDAPRAHKLHVAGARTPAGARRAVIIEPSNTIKDRGLFVGAEDEFRTKAEIGGAIEAVDWLKREFDGALAGLGDLVNAVLDGVTDDG